MKVIFILFKSFHFFHILLLIKKNEKKNKKLKFIILTWKLRKSDFIFILSFLITWDKTIIVFYSVFMFKQQDNYDYFYNRNNLILMYWMKF